MYTAEALLKGIAIDGLALLYQPIPCNADVVADPAGCQGALKGVVGFSVHHDVTSTPVNFVNVLLQGCPECRTRQVGRKR